MQGRLVGRCAIECEAKQASCVIEEVEYKRHGVHEGERSGNEEVV